MAWEPKPDGTWESASGPVTLPTSLLNWHPHPDGVSDWLPPGSDVAGITAAVRATASANAVTAKALAHLRVIIPAAEEAAAQLDAAGYGSHAAMLQAELDQARAVLAELS